MRGKVGRLWDLGPIEQQGSRGGGDHMGKWKTDNRQGETGQVRRQSVVSCFVVGLALAGVALVPSGQNSCATRV